MCVLLYIWIYPFYYSNSTKIMICIKSCSCPVIFVSSKILPMGKLWYFGIYGVSPRNKLAQFLEEICSFTPKYCKLSNIVIYFVPFNLLRCDFEVDTHERVKLSFYVEQKLYTTTIEFTLLLHPNFTYQNCHTVYILLLILFRAISRNSNGFVLYMTRYWIR